MWNSMSNSSTWLQHVISGKKVSESGFIQKSGFSHNFAYKSTKIEIEGLSLAFHTSVFRVLF